MLKKKSLKVYLIQTNEAPKWWCSWDILLQENDYLFISMDTIFVGMGNKVKIYWIKYLQFASSLNIKLGKH